jgi:hypothetical protein
VEAERGRGFLEGEDFGSARGVWTWRSSSGGWEGGVWCPSEVSVVEEEVRR